MLKQKKQPIITESQFKLYEDGLIMGKSNLLEQTEITEDFLLEMKKKLKKSFMQECLHKNRNLIYKTKLNISKKDTQNMNLSPTLARELISKEKGYKEFWTDSSTELSKKLWLPPKTDLLDSDLIYSNISLSKSVLNSRLLIPKKVKMMNQNYPKTCYQSLQFSQPDIMDEEDIIVTRKIRIYPSKKQKLFFNKCFGTTRFIYNKVVEFINQKYYEKKEEINKLKNNGCIKFIKNNQCCKSLSDNHSYFCNKHKKSKINYDFKLNLPYLRKQVLVNDKDLPTDMLWLKEIPYDTRQLVIKDFIGAYKAAITNLKKGNHEYFSMKYKSRKNPSQIFHIDKRAIKPNLFLFKKRKIGRLRTRKRMKKWIEKNINGIIHDCKIIRYKPNQYYLLLSKNQKNISIKASCKSVSLDPGIRTFQTFYSPDGVAGKLGKNIFKKHLYKYAKKIDILDTIKSKCKKRKTKMNISKKQFLLRTKIKNVITDYHWKIAHFLCTNFETIIIPDFKVKKMTLKRKRNITNNITRKMLTLSHYGFKKKLEHKCKIYKRRLIVTSEAYTSKTCGVCGNVDKNLGSKKILQCHKCNIEIDRDYNGARNILLRVCSHIK